MKHWWSRATKRNGAFDYTIVECGICHLKKVLIRHRKHGATLLCTFCD